MHVITVTLPSKLVPLYFTLGVLLTHAKCDINCTYSKTSVVCENVNLTEKIASLNIADTVETVRISGGSVFQLPPFLFSDCSEDPAKELKNLKHLDLSGNQIREIDGDSFRCFPNLETLSLANNSWYVRNKTDVFSNLSNLKKLDLSHGFDHMYNETTRMVVRLSRVMFEAKLFSLEELDLSNNDLLVFTEESSSTMCNMTKLKRLYLANNSLSKVSLYHECSTSLKYLDLSDNSFERLTNNTLKLFDSIRSKSPDFTVNLQKNEWDCDCNLIDFVNWLNSTNVAVLNKQNFTCHDGLSFHKALVHLKSQELVCHSYPVDSFVRAPIIVLGIVLAVICLVVIVAIFTRRKRIADWCKDTTHRSSREDGYAIV